MNISRVFSNFKRVRNEEKEEENLLSEKKSKVIAALLNVFLPGGGYFYVQEPLRAFTLYVVMVLVIIANVYAFVPDSFLLGARKLLTFLTVIDAIRIAATKTEYKKKSFFSLYAPLALILIFMVSLISYVVLGEQDKKQDFFIHNHSMEPTLFSGASVMYHPFSKDHPIQRGKVISFSVTNKQQKSFFTKRCIALGGDEVLYADKTLYVRFHEGNAYMKDHFPASQIVMLDDHRNWVKNPYFYKYPGIYYDKNVDTFQQMGRLLSANRLPMRSVFLPEFPKKQGFTYNAFYMKIPQDKVFLLGDNRDHSNDSKFYGVLSIKQILGYVTFADGTSIEEHTKAIREILIQKKLAENKNLPSMLRDDLQSLKNTSGSPDEITLNYKYTHYTKKNIIKHYKNEQDFLVTFADNEKLSICSLFNSNKNNALRDYLLAGIKVREIYFDKNDQELLEVRITKKSCLPYLYTQTSSDKE